MENFLTIRNFGPITDATLELKQVMIITGAQGTGKSTIAKLLSIFSDVVFSLNILHKDKENLLSQFAFHGIKSYFQDNTYLEYNKNDIHIVYEDKEFRIILAEGVDEKKFEDFLVRRWGNALGDLMESLGIADSKNGDEIQTIIKKNAHLIKADSRFSLYIPAERNLAGAFSNALASMMLANIPLPHLFTTYLSCYEKAKNEFSNYEVPFLNLEFKKEGTDEKVVFNHDKQVDMQYCSSGVQSVLPLLMIMDYCVKKDIFDCFIIEEPEQNLFPENQMELARFIISKLHKENPVQELVITTHSPYILSTLNISLLAGKIAENGKYNEALEQILTGAYRLDSKNVAAYSLGDSDVYAKDIINKMTGTIDQNYLDSTSLAISEAFNQLYQLYLKSLRE